MTLTSIMPSLRASIPDPIATDSWPVATRPTTVDVLVGGVSLRHLAALCQTPCVHVADATLPGTHGRTAADVMTSVVVMTVTCVRIVEGRGVEVTTDAHLDHALWSEARLVGRASTARSVRVSMLGLPDGDRLHLPADVRPGDLLAVPCEGAVSLADVRPAARRAPSPMPTAVLA